MKYIKFKFSIDEDVRKTHKINEPVSIEYLVATYLNDPDGWPKHGYFFESVDRGESVLIRLSSSSTIHKICGLPENLSCAELGGRFMYLNASRWFFGSKESKLSLEDYRQYMVTHEIGHILGHDHKTCPCKNCLAPVMMQQTLGLKGCRPNTSI